MTVNFGLPDPLLREYVEKLFQSELSGNVIDLCPVGLRFWYFVLQILFSEHLEL